MKVASTLPRNNLSSDINAWWRDIECPPISSLTRRHFCFTWRGFWVTIAFVYSCLRTTDTVRESCGHNSGSITDNWFDPNALLAQCCLVFVEFITLLQLKLSGIWRDTMHHRKNGKAQIVAINYVNFLFSKAKVAWGGNIFGAGFVSVTKFEFKRETFLRVKSENALVGRAPVSVRNPINSVKWSFLTTCMLCKLKMSINQTKSQDVFF